MLGRFLRRPNVGRGTLLALASIALACRGSEVAVPVADETIPPCLELPKRIAPPVARRLNQRAQAEAAFEKGQALARRYDWTPAKEAFRRALSFDPSFGWAHLGIAEASAHLGGSAPARRTHLALALLDLPRSPEAHTRFANVLDESGEPRFALTHFRCALDLAAGLREARRRATRLALDVEGSTAAQALLRPLLLESSTQARDWILAADVRAAAGQKSAAAEAMERAATEAASAALYRRAAQLWNAAGAPERAATAVQKADRIAPPPERRRLRELRPARMNEK